MQPVRFGPESDRGDLLNTTDGSYTGRNPALDPYRTVAVPSSSTTCGGWTANGNQNLHLAGGSNATLQPSTAGGTCAVPQEIKMDGGSTLNLTRARARASGSGYMCNLRIAPQGYRCHQVDPAPRVSLRIRA
jgi:hypothetical protein